MEEEEEIIIDEVVRVFPTYAFVKKMSEKYDGEPNPVLLAFGKAVDIMLSQYNYYQQFTFRPLVKEALRCGLAVFNEELREYDVKLSPKERKYYAIKLWRIINCWRKSKYSDMLRPKTHVILIEREDEFIGVFAQPDFYSSNTFYELKSFDIEKEKKMHVEVQAKVFSLLGNLKLIYFTEDENGYVSIKEKDVSVSKEEKEKILKELWSFGKKYCETEEYYLYELEDEYPLVRYEIK